MNISNFVNSTESETPLDKGDHVVNNSNPVNASESSVEIGEKTIPATNISEKVLVADELAKA